MITAYSNTRSVTTLREPAFMFTMDTRNTTSGSTASNQYKLPLVTSSTATYPDSSLDIMVDWGDGNVDNITAYNQPEVTHTYATAGEYLVKITGGVFGWRQRYTGDRNKMLDIKQWDGLIITEIETFANCQNLTTNAHIDFVIATDNLESLFDGCTVFNSPVNHLDISGVKYLNYIFSYTEAFNQPLDQWDTSSVEEMYYSFSSALAFDQNIGSWDVSNVQYMTGTFESAVFNNGGSPSINNWNTSSVIDMEGLFWYNERFNQPIGNWDVSNVTTFYRTFQDNNIFNQDISNWDISNATDVQNMFYNNKGFQNGGVPIDWEITGYCWSMFGDSAYNNPITLRFTGTDQVVRYLFAGSSGAPTPFNQDVSGWDVSGVYDWTSAFEYSNFNDPGILSWNWNTTSMYQMNLMFRGTTAFNQPILAEGSTLLTVPNFATYLMFNESLAFNNGGQPVAESDAYYNNGGIRYAVWSNANGFTSAPFDIDFSRYTSLYNMFNTTPNYDADISYWDVSNLTNGGNLFKSSGGLSTSNYDAALISWSEKLPTRTTTSILSFGTSKYTPGGAAEAARTAIIAKGWTKQDGGAA